MWPNPQETQVTQVGHWTAQVADKKTSLEIKKGHNQGFAGRALLRQRKQDLVWLKWMWKNNEVEQLCTGNS